MNLGEIVTTISRRLGDPAILKADIVTEVNKKLLLIAGQVRMPPLIKANEAITVNAGDTSVSMPSDYHHDLLAVWDNTNGGEPTIRLNRSSLYKSYNRSETSSRVNEVAVEGSVLWVRPKVSQNVELLVDYYRMPQTLTNDSDIPEGIPPDLHHDLLVCGPLAELLPDSPDDYPVKERRKSYNIDRFANGIGMLKNVYPHAPRMRVVLRRRVREF